MLNDEFYTYQVGHSHCALHCAEKTPIQSFIRLVPVILTSYRRLRQTSPIALSAGPLVAAKLLRFRAVRSTTIP